MTTERGQQYTFDLLIGSDGLNSIVRRTLFPDVQPKPPTTNCAYRAIVPYAQVRQDPLAREVFEKLTMEVWMAPQGYIITYPISAGRDLNLVLSHHVANPPRLVDKVEDVPISEMRDYYADYDPRIKRVLGMIDTVQRWPLMRTGPLPSWSNAGKNVVLMGDAAHSMTNHMAQGAATAMEDGAFLGRCIALVVEGRISVAKAIEVYEKERMPKAKLKQQISFLNGAIWHLPDGPAQRARDAAMKVELEEKPYTRTPNLYGDPATVLSVYGYDAEAHADEALCKEINGRERGDEAMAIDKRVSDGVMGWFLPEEYEGQQVKFTSKL